MDQHDAGQSRRAGSERPPENGRAIDEPAIRFYTERVRPLREVRAGDIPAGLEPEDVATDTVEAGSDEWPK